MGLELNRLVTPTKLIDTDKTAENARIRQVEKLN